MAWRVTLVGVPLNGDTLDELLALLTRKNVAYLRSHPNTPRLYQSGVRYQVEPSGKEDWLTIPEVLARRVADCEDLACYRAAELIVRDGETKARAFWTKMRADSNGTLYHIRVRRANGTIEDPSYILGMR